jgi:hypothetical protein
MESAMSMIDPLISARFGDGWNVENWEALQDGELLVFAATLPKMIVESVIRGLFAGAGPVGIPPLTGETREAIVEAMILLSNVDW